MNRPALGSSRCGRADCGPLVIDDGSTHGCCRGCGLVCNLEGGGAVVDPSATLNALFDAADACAGGDCSLQALAFNRYGADQALHERIDRLALAETGVASLARLGWCLSTDG